MSEHGEIPTTMILVSVLVLVLASLPPMSQHARAAIPVPHNLYGHAWDVGGVNYTPGEFMSAWIDGVMYGWNLTFDDILDPEYPVSNWTSKIDIDTAGNHVTKPGDPDTPWVKEGGDHNIDDIMYVWGDMTETTVTLGSPTTIFEQTTVWQTFGVEYINLSIAPTQPPALPKINNIVTLPNDAGTQYIYIFGPPGTPMDEFYLEKNDGVLHNVATQIFLSGTISETMYFYVDLGATDYLGPLGDELKLVWENPGGPGTPFGGMDVVVDRVEYNATAGGTHFGEPDNTIMPDANPPGPTFDIHRQPMPGFDTNDCSADFISGFEPGRPPAAPYPLSVEGLQATGPGQTIDDVSNMVNPLLGWTHQDPGMPPSPQFGYRLEIATDPAFAVVTWSSYQPVAGGYVEAYGGPPLTPGTCYYYRARTRDAFDYGPWANTTMCMRPRVPILTSAVLDGANNENVLISWSISPGDGGSGNDISHFAIYFSHTYDHEGAGYSYLGLVDKNETSYTHASAGDGDWNSYFYHVQANYTDGSAYWTGQAGKFVRHMEKGKQIASIPLAQADTTLETVLQTLDGSYKHVRYYKSSDQGPHWKSYWTFKRYRTLFDIDHTMGFWIDITKPDDLVVAGLVPEVTQIELGHGWNFVGYPSFIERTLSQALAGVDWEKAQGYDDNPPFNLKQLSGTDVMAAGEGYWVWVDLPQTWDI